MKNSDTIFAISSGAGLCGVCVIRVSGPAAFRALGQLAGKMPEDRRATLRQLRDPVSGEVLDEGVVIVFRGPASCTGEDSCEFHIHGGRAVQKAVLEALGALPGLRAAEPGEFTRRAVHNGRLDLLAAEGLSDLIRARTEGQRRQALAHSLGRASAAVEDWRRRLTGILGRVEAALDFSDERDVTAEALSRVAVPLGGLIAEMEAALRDARRGAAIRDGIRVVLAGPPNVGKSSILNWLAGREAAIVSAIPGTTRDVIEVEIVLAGVPAIISDTAGLRDGSADEIEQIGMARTRRELSAADVVIWVTSADQPHTGAVPVIDSKAIWIENKSDLRTGGCPGPTHFVSAKTGCGMDKFVDILRERVANLSGAGESAILIRVRHEQAVSRCIANLKAAIDSDPERIELIAEKMRSAAHALATITGAIGVEDVLDSIFREFCIGK